MISNPKTDSKKCILCNGPKYFFILGDMAPQKPDLESADQKVRSPNWIQLDMPIRTCRVDYTW